jgi:hypothetical protein
VITVNGGFVARVIANKFRNDLQKVDGQGRLAFEFEFTECLSPLERVVIDVRSELDGTQLPRSPRAIERSSDFNPQMRQAVSDLLLSFHTDAEAEDRLGFLAERTQRAPGTPQVTMAQWPGHGRGAAGKASRAIHQRQASRHRKRRGIECGRIAYAVPCPLRL